jgi:D-alanyl-D-alanine carboxypeptidase
MVAILMAAGGVCCSLTSAVALQPAAPGNTGSIASRSLPAEAIDLDLAPRNLRFAPQPTASATPLPASTPAPTPANKVKSAATTRPLPTARPIPIPAVDVQEIALVNLDNGHFLWRSNDLEPRAPASLTKIFTAMVAVDLIGLNTTVSVPASITTLPADSTFMGLSPGERVTVRDLLYGVFLRSGNDAAETLATAVTSRATFIADMNAKAARLGLRTTHFTNPTGLDQAGHYSSAYDMAIASIYLESHYGSLVDIAATPSIHIPASASHKTFNLVSLNKLLWTYPGTYGLKTGWTDAALGCLLTTSSRGGHRILAVMLGAPAGTANAQMPAVLDYGFQLLGILPRPQA